jgi:hypothetical protein
MNEDNPSSNAKYSFEITTLNNNVNKPDLYAMTMNATGGIIGATVSALVYSAITTTGDIAASVTSSGISLTGEAIALGTEYIAGTMAGNSVRVATRTTSAIAGPTISTSSRTVAAGVALISGAVAAITTSLVIYGAHQAGSYLYSCTEKYKQKVAEKIQYPMDISNFEKGTVEELISFDDENELIQSSPLLLTNDSLSPINIS